MIERSIKILRANGDVIIRQLYTDSDGYAEYNNIILKTLEDAEYLRDQLNKIISEMRVKYAGYEKRNS